MTEGIRTSREEDATRIDNIARAVQGEILANAGKLQSHSWQFAQFPTISSCHILRLNAV
jgi:hypothetical protein